MDEGGRSNIFFFFFFTSVIFFLFLPMWSMSLSVSETFHLAVTIDLLPVFQDLIYSSWQLMEAVWRCGTKMAHRQDGHSVSLEEYIPVMAFSFTGKGGDVALVKDFKKYL